MQVGCVSKQRNFISVIVFLLLFLSSVCFAAPDRIVALYPQAATDPGPLGNDDFTQRAPGTKYNTSYTTMLLMEDGEDGDLVTATNMLYVEIINSDGSWNGAPDTSYADFDGWTCDADYFIDNASDEQVQTLIDTVAVKGAGNSSGSSSYLKPMGLWAPSADKRLIGGANSLARYLQQNEAPAATDMFGAVPVAEQTLADKQRDKDEKRNGSQDVPADIDGGLFSNLDQ